MFIDKIVSLGFTFGNADLGIIGQAGIPKVQKGKPLTFVNFDTVADIWHTFTGCKYPCTGSYGLDYPVANGAATAGDPKDFDSTEIGYGLFYSPASGQFGGDKSPQQALQDGLYATFTPTQNGVYTLYCRIHPAMRGAFEVVG
jgi:plastocyanin